jgi:asparagine synthase (glutamine-hydrolysing)
MLNEMFHEAVPVILHEDDLNAMYFSIENRSPFLDRDLFEFCYRVPTRFLIQDGRAKAVLRDAMRGIVPPRILDNRRKVGFNAPIHGFLDVADSDVRQYLLATARVDLVRRERISALLDKTDLPNRRVFLFNRRTKMFLEEFADDVLPRCVLPSARESSSTRRASAMPVGRTTQTGYRLGARGRMLRRRAAREGPQSRGMHRQ